MTVKAAQRLPRYEGSQAGSLMAEVTSGTNLTVIVLDEAEAEADAVKRRRPPGGLVPAGA